MDGVFTLLVGQRQQAGTGGIDVRIRRQFGYLIRSLCRLRLLLLALRHGPIIALPELLRERTKYHIGTDDDRKCR